MDLTTIIFILLGMVVIIVVNNMIYYRFFQSSLDRAQSGQIADLASKIENVKNDTRDQLIRINETVTKSFAQNQAGIQQSSQNLERWAASVTKMSEELRNVHESVKEVSSFQEIFRSPKLRGRWGESSLEYMLAQYFSQDAYKVQYTFKSGEMVDAVLKLPNNRLLPIDAKFPLENFEKMVNAEKETEKVAYRKLFVADVKTQIDDITKKYILPSEGTMDLALMYIPAEAVYYEVINNLKEFDLQQYAASKKVTIVSPNTFRLSLYAIMDWFKDRQVSKQTQEIIKKLGRVISDAQQLGEIFKRLGKHLSDTRSSYEDSERRLSLMTERVEKLIEIGAETPKQIEEKTG